MNSVRVSTVTGERGGVHLDIETTDLPPGTRVDVVVTPHQEAERGPNGLKKVRLPEGRRISLTEDPLEFQRRIRAEWPE